MASARSSRTALKTHISAWLPPDGRVRLPDRQYLRLQHPELRGGRLVLEIFRAEGRGPKCRDSAPNTLPWGCGQTVRNDSAARDGAHQNLLVITRQISRSLGPEGISPAPSGGNKGGNQR